tara:strand:+ start:136 stop:444 length:309 start_codon:yes stop_codon:yes gene_type:complete
MKTYTAWADTIDKGLILIEYKAETQLYVRYGGLEDDYEEDVEITPIRYKSPSYGFWQPLNNYNIYLIDNLDDIKYDTLDLMLEESRDAATADNEQLTNQQEK